MLLFFILSSSIILLFILLKYISKRKINKLPLNTLKESPELFLRFLDSFYVTNIYFTIFCTFCYFFFTVFFIIIIRFIFLGYENNINAIDLNYFYFHFLIKIILFLIIIFLIKTIIDALFFKEVLKFYLYLCQSYKIRSFISDLYSNYNFYDFVGPINLFLYCVSTLKVIPTEDDEDYQEFYYYKTIYEKTIIKNITNFCVKYSIKYKYILWFFKFLHYFVNVIYEHFRWYKFLYFFYLIIFFIIIFYDFINFKFYYTYYYFFFFCIITFIFRFFKFMELKGGFKELLLVNYFYRNEVAYNIQRIFINNKDLYYYKDMKNKSKENQALINEMKESILGDFITFVYNNLQKHPEDMRNKTVKENEKKEKNKYLIYFVTIIFIIILIYFIFYGTRYVIILNILEIKIPTRILIMPILVIMYLSIKIYVLPKKATEDFIGNYISNKTYARVFWLLVILQSIILIIFFYYTNILEFFSDNALWNNLGLSIYMKYTIIEKQQYFCYLFDEYFIAYQDLYNLKQLKQLAYVKEYLLDNITENTKIKEIQGAIYSIILRCSLENNAESFQECFNKLNIENNLNNLKHFCANDSIYQIMLCIKNSLYIYVLMITLLTLPTDLMLILYYKYYLADYIYEFLLVRNVSFAFMTDIEIKDFCETIAIKLMQKLESNAIIDFIFRKDK